MNKFLLEKSFCLKHVLLKVERFVAKWQITYRNGSHISQWKLLLKLITNKPTNCCFWILSVHSCEICYCSFAHSQQKPNPVTTLLLKACISKGPDWEMLESMTRFVSSLSPTWLYERMPSKTEGVALLRSTWKNRKKETHPQNKGARNPSLPSTWERQKHFTCLQSTRTERSITQDADLPLHLLLYKPRLQKAGDKVTWCACIHEKKGMVYTLLTFNTQPKPCECV